MDIKKSLWRHNGIIEDIYISSAAACVCQQASPQSSIIKLKTREERRERVKPRHNWRGESDEMQRKSRRSGGRGDDKDKWVWGSYSPLHSLLLSLEEFCYSIQQLVDNLGICRKLLETNISFVKALHQYFHSNHTFPYHPYLFNNSWSKCSVSQIHGCADT